jgi:hypothetical protein
MNRLLQYALLCAAALFAVPAAMADVLDPGFADEGVRVLDFTPDVNAGGRGVVNCPAAGDRQLVVVREVGALLVARLDFDGSLDPTFADAGVRRHTLWAGTQDSATVAAVCRADGGIWIVATHQVAADDWRIRLIALDATGALAPGGAFGPSGHADVDLAPGGLLPGRSAFGFNQSRDGRAFATGYVQTSATDWAPWIIALDAQGGLQGARVFHPEGVGGSVQARAVGVGPGGGLWVVGRGFAASGRIAFRAYLDPKSLELVRTETFSIPGEDIDVAGGSMVRDGVMVVGAARRAPTGGPASPILLVMRANSTITMLDLPAPAPMEDGGRTGISAAGQPISSLPGGSVLYGIGAEAWIGSVFNGYKGWYFARAVIGASALEDHVDTSFGDNGSAVLSIHSGEPDCAGLLNTQQHSRAGIWQGRPTVIGWWKRHCAPEQDAEGLLMRLQAGDSIFGNGFE